MRIKLSDTFICTGCLIKKENRNFTKKRDKRRVRQFASKCKDCEAKRIRKFSKTRVFKQIAKSRRLKYRFDISLQEWESMYIKQKGLCAICGIPQEKVSKTFCVDHNHSTKQVRELLCHLCNTGLGSFKDDVSILRKAVEYLEKHILL